VTLEVTLDSLLRNEIRKRFWKQFVSGSIQRQGRIQDFKLGGGGTLKKNCGGRREHFWGISCEKSRFYAKKIIFFPIAEGDAEIVWVFRVKNHDFKPNKSYFFQF
jgi:hypothetical protein